jgi:hypothetical protein
MNTLLLRLLSSALLAITLAGCAGGPGPASDFDFGGVTTYAWKEPASFGRGATDGEQGELADFERRVQRMLERRGIELVAKDRAQILLSGQILIDERTHELDPNYSVYSAERFEVAILSLEVYDRKNRKLVWTDDEESRLRTTGRRFGRRLVEEFSATDEVRRWRIYDMVDALLARLPE